ncbi:MAG: hypothetical protein OXP69_20820 [Spirochaetaceae bacterium]|nr:hypothetical protein [Spirochaetaceae bacterium]
MLEPYPPELTEKIEQLVERLKQSPPEAFLAVLHTIHLLAEQVRDSFFENLHHSHSEEDYDRAEADWKTARLQLTDRLIRQSSKVNPVQIQPESYLRSAVILLDMVESLPGNAIGILGGTISHQREKYGQGPDLQESSPPAADDFDEDLPL